LGSCASWSAVNRAVGPGGGWLYRASTPPSRARFSHRLTAPLVTPKASAIAVPVQPCWWSAHARSLRPSRQSRGERGFLLLMALVYHAGALVYFLTPASVSAGRCPRDGSE